VNFTAFFRAQESILKILYVEDTEEYTKAVRRLAKHLGHQVILAVTGTEGYALAQEHPDLILLDINLPDINGLTLARQLREAHITVPIIAITADLMNYDRKQALEAGCSEFIEKPFSFETLERLFDRYAI
jgi:CheY-like chemotaxis protein